jgi:hypothetical protein
MPIGWGICWRLSRPKVVKTLNFKFFTALINSQILKISNNPNSSKNNFLKYQFPKTLLFYQCITFVSVLLSVEAIYFKNYKDV